MPDQKISVDPAAADLSGCIIPVVTGGINKQAANSLFGITGVANGIIYSAGNRNTSNPTNFNYVPGTQTLTVVGPIRTSPVTNEATVATPANGMIIYSTALSKFRAYENGAWVNLIGGATPAWLLASGGILTGPNIIDQTTTAGNTVTFLTPNLGVTPIDGKGLWIQNATAAAAGAQQISGAIVQEGQGWATTPAASQSVKARQYVSPGQATSNPNLTWVLQWSINNAAYVNGLVLQYGGATTNLTITGLCIADSFANARGQFAYSGNDIYVDNSTSGGAMNFRVNALTQAMKIQSNGDLSLGSTSDLAKLYVLQSALSSSWLSVLRIDPGAHTSLTAATEFKDYNFTTRTATWLAGTTATQRFAHFQGQTVAGASASATFTDLYTVYIDPSIQGSQAIITNNWALGLGGGLKLFAGTTTRPALVIPTGTNLTTSQAGAMENDGTHLWFTFANSGARWQLDNQVGTFGWALAGNTLVADGIIGDVGTGGFKISLYTNNTARQVISSKGNFTFNQDAQSTSHTFISFTQGNHTSGTPLGINYNAGGATTLTANTEPTDVSILLGRTVQFATGAHGGVRAIYISNPIYSFVGASVMAIASLLTLAGAPIAGNNATITNTHVININSNSVITGTGIVTNSYALTANAQTGATNNYAAQFLGGNVGIGLSAPLSALDVAGSFGTNTRTITASATLATTDHTVLCDSTSGVVAATLPTASGAKGRIYVVKKIDASANNVTLATVDGGTKTITTRYSGFAVQSDGSLWYVIASF